MHLNTAKNLPLKAAYFSELFFPHKISGHYINVVALVSLDFRSSHSHHIGISDNRKLKSTNVR
jgi:hypothetical protein